MFIRMILTAAILFLWIVLVSAVYVPIKQFLVDSGLSLTLTVSLLLTLVLAGAVFFTRWTWRRSMKRFSR